MPLGPDWRKSTYSGTHTCVEVATVEQPPGTSPDTIHVQVRNSRDRHGPVLTFTAEEWQAFLDGIRNGEFNLPTEAVARPLYPELADDLKYAGEQAARHKAGLA